MFYLSDVILLEKFHDGIKKYIFPIEIRDFFSTFVKIARTNMDNKTLVDTLSKNLDISRDTVISLIDGLSAVVGECGADLDSISIPAFGTFEPRKRMERVAVHPASGKRLLVPPKIVLSFKPSPVLKQRVRNGE